MPPKKLVILDCKMNFGGRVCVLYTWLDSKSISLGVNGLFLFCFSFDLDAETHFVARNAK